MEGEKRPTSKYEKEFIVEAVKMVLEGGQTVADTARNLGIHENLLYKWKRDYVKDPLDVFPGKEHTKPLEEEL